MNFKKLFSVAALVMVSLSAAVSPAAQKKPDLRPPLYVAIARHDVAAVQSAIQQGADVNAIYEKDTMVGWGLARGYPEIARLILQASGIDVNKRCVANNDFGDWDRTPLIQAAFSGDAESVSTLLRMGAKVNVRDSREDHWPESRGRTALLWAAYKGHFNVVTVLANEAKGLDVELADKDGLTALWYVALGEDAPSLKLLHQRGAKVSTTNRNGDSILTVTYEHKKREVLDYLVARGANINHLNSQGSTPLMSAILSPDSELGRTFYNFIDYFTATFKPKLDLQQIKKIPGGEAGGTAALHVAATYGNLDVMNLLLDRGATLELKSLASGGTALHYAVDRKKLEAARLLIQRKANVDARDALGDTPLIHAVNNADPAMVQLLVDSGATINVKSTSNVMVTPLVRAATDPNTFNNENLLNIINILLSAKGDIDFKSGDGSTALMAAARQSNTGQGYERAALLINKGANLDLKNNKGETALMLATGSGNEKLVRLLIDKGADPKLKNLAGETAMSYANRRGNSSVGGLLESKGLQQEAPVVKQKVIVGALLGTWQGTKEGLSQAVMQFVFNKDNTYGFVSRLAPEVLRKLPAGAMNPVIATHKGTYTTEGNTLILYPEGQAPVAMTWTLANGLLVMDGNTRMKKTK